MSSFILNALHTRGRQAETDDLYHSINNISNHGRIKIYIYIYINSYLRAPLTFESVNWSLIFIELVAPKRAGFFLGPAINTLQVF